MKTLIILYDYKSTLITFFDSNFESGRLFLIFLFFEGKKCRLNANKCVMWRSGTKKWRISFLLNTNFM
jgi:hypothetical protein